MSKDKLRKIQSFEELKVIEQPVVEPKPTKSLSERIIADENKRNLKFFKAQFKNQ